MAYHTESCSFHSMNTNAIKENNHIHSNMHKNIQDAVHVKFSKHNKTDWLWNSRPSCPTSFYAQYIEIDSLSDIQFKVRLKLKILSARGMSIYTNMKKIRKPANWQISGLVTIQYLNIVLAHRSGSLTRQQYILLAIKKGTKLGAVKCW